MRAFLAIAVLGGGVAHATVGSALRIADVAPDIPLIVVVLLALRRGPEFGCGAGFVAGLLQDAATGGLGFTSAFWSSVLMPICFATSAWICAVVQVACAGSCVTQLVT